MIGFALDRRRFYYYFSCQVKTGPHPNMLNTEHDYVIAKKAKWFSQAYAPLLEVLHAIVLLLKQRGSSKEG